ncbi:MAG: DUF92 domain-containing protein [Acidobacteria bacterium]|nr:DUF92 domain-containing protein [Acidobacteriota bacterium]
MTIGPGIHKNSSRGYRPISPARNRLQSRLLTGAITGLILLAITAQPIATHRPGQSLQSAAIPLLVSLVFGAVVWAVRAATIGGVALGALICFLLTQAPRISNGAPASSIGQSALPALIAVFAISFVSTRFGRSRKEKRGLAEGRRGRHASQIAANLGVAALFAAAGYYQGCVAALAEAAADTASSEIGQTIGGSVRLLTAWKTVPAGTNGGVTVAGTIAAIAGAAITVLVAALNRVLWPHAATIFASACAGVFFDSLLGATVENRGWIGNDLVNFASTLFAALLATLLSRQ